MKRLALSIAVVGFFVMAGVGWACDNEPLTCAIRAAVGAFALYVVLRVAGGVAANILADAILRHSPQDRRQKDQ